MMIIVGDRLRALRETKEMSQKDIESKAGLACSYVSRCENGFTVPSVESLERWARALDVPLYQIFYEVEDRGHSASAAPHLRGLKGIKGRELENLRQLLSKMSPEDRLLLLTMAEEMARHKS